MSLTSTQRTLLERIEQHGLRRRTDGRRGTRYWVPDDGAAANKAVVQRLANARYIAVRRIGLVSDLAITDEGRAALAADAQ